MLESLKHFGINMSASLKLSKAAKAVHCLARVHPNALSSDAISTMTGVNASQLRQILSLLTKTGFIRSIQGAGGGFILNIPPEEINLQQLYCAIETRKAFHLSVGDNNGQPELSKKINDYFLRLFEEIQKDIETKMETITLADLMEEVEE